jgi:hypothetical protein
MEQSSFAEIPMSATGGFSPTGSTQELLAQPTKALAAFTGKITKNKVRMRLQPNLDGYIVKELNPNDLVLVLGQNEEFYAVQPPADTKAYIYRTFVLDGVVEGSHVNVRLEPDLGSPIIVQLNSGAIVAGKSIPDNKKWLEIAPPTTARFYVAKEFVEKAGDPSMYNKYAQEVAAFANRDTSIAYEASIAAAPPTTPATPPRQAPNPAAPYTTKSNSGYPTQSQPLPSTSYNSTQQYVPKQTITPTQTIEPTPVTNPNQSTITIPNPTTNPPQPLNPIQQQLNPQPTSQSTSQQQTTSTQDVNKVSMTSKMAQWQDSEQDLYESWIALNDSSKSIKDFYKAESENAITLQGILEPYNRSVKNKPGDYVLVSTANHLPIAYLYSTQVNLQDSVGHEVVIGAIPRDNHNFAYPAYFVISVE